MFAKKLFAFAAAGALCVGLFAGTALADDGSTTPSLPPVMASASDGWRQEVKADLATIMQLRKQTEAERAANKELTQANKALLKELRQTLKDLKGSPDQLKTERGSVQSLLGQLRALWEQEKHLHEKDQALTQSLSEARDAFKAAKAADDHDGMLKALNTIISLKQQILANLQQIHEIKTQVNTLLTAAVGSQGSTSGINE